MMTTINFGDASRDADTDVIGEIVGLYRGKPPASFELIVHELYASRLLSFDPIDQAGSDTYEFFMRLVIDKGRPPIKKEDRMRLLCKSALEQVAGFSPIFEKAFSLDSALSA
jgi:hypothetical protein